MTAPDLSSVPEALRPAFEALIERLQRLFAGDLIGFSVYGGWLKGDPFLEGELATSVLTLEKDNLSNLSNLAMDGIAFAKKGLRAPYLMPRDYLHASRDTFPLELLEIQQTGSRVLGEDLFGPLKFDRRFVRLQCERNLKAELMYLRQGLLRHDATDTMKAIFRPCLVRLLPAMRGVLLLKGVSPAKADALPLVQETARATGLGLSQIERFVDNPPARLGEGPYIALYDEIKTISAFVDALPDNGADGTSGTSTS